MPLNIIVTDAGRAALINAAHTGTAPTTIAEIGFSETAIEASQGDTVLDGEIKRIAGVGGQTVAADTVQVSALDQSEDAFTLRSFALYLADGTLFALYGQADPILEKTAVSLAALSVQIQFADIDAEELTFGDVGFLSPSATTEVQGVVELATNAEAAAGLDALRALTPAAAKAAVLAWLLTQDGSGSGLDADLLDGQDGSYYANVAARLGFTPVNKAGDTMGGALALTDASTVGDGAGNNLEVGFRDIPQNARSSNYTLAATDRGKHIYHPTTDAAARNWTIPANADVPLPVRAAITFVNDGGPLTIVPAAGVTLVWALTGGTGARSMTGKGMATALQVAPNRWMIDGSGLT
jgi:hypothetical protein